jgi:tetratricopeptide (TPR) repeat protein
MLPPDENARRAGLLNNLGRALSDLGRREEALEAAKEASDTYRQLAQKNPDAFLPDLAMSFNNLGAILSDLGRREEALEAAKEAVTIRRQLAKKNPDAFLPNLATSLGALGGVLQSLDRDDDAAGAFHEGLQSIFPFFKALPQAFAGLVGALFKDYLQTCEKAGQEPDMELLNQFANLDSSSGSSP